MALALPISKLQIIRILHNIKINLEGNIMLHNKKHTLLGSRKIIVSLLIIISLSSCVNKAKENLSHFTCTLSSDNNPRRYIQISFKDSFMYMYSHDYKMVRGYEDSLGNMVFEVEPNFKMDSVKLTALEMDSLNEYLKVIEKIDTTEFIRYSTSYRNMEFKYKDKVIMTKSCYYCKDKRFDNIYTFFIKRYPHDIMFE